MKKKKQEIIFENANPKQEKDNEEVKKKLEEGRLEAIKDREKEKIKNSQKIKELLEESRKVLVKVSSIFPFDLFPDEIWVEPAKVDIINRNFFDTEKVHSVAIKDIFDVFIETSPFFSTLKIIDKGFVENTVDVKFLDREEAREVRRIIQGLIEASKKDINFSDYNIEDIKKIIEELGQSG